MSNGRYPQRKFSKLDETDRVIVSAMGGAILGSSLFGMPGTIIIGLIGAIAGAARNEEIRKLQERKCND